MTIGKITMTDIGKWLLLDDGRAMKLIGFRYGLLRCQSQDGIWWIPYHDVVRRIKEDAALERTMGTEVKQRNPHGLAKCVVSTDRYGNERKFDSITVASGETGIALSSISSVCRGKRKTAGGFAWRYESV